MCYKQGHLSFINEFDLVDAMLTDKPEKTRCMNLAKERLRHAEIEKWKNKLMHDGNDQNGNKLRTNRTYKTEFQTEHYVKVNMSRDQRKQNLEAVTCH